MKKYFLYLTLFLFPSFVFAQDEEESFDRMITFVPQYLINNGIRVDFDKKIRGKHWLHLAPQLYLRDMDPGVADEQYRDFHKLYGAGMFLYHKRFAGAQAVPEGAYISYGVTYQFFHLGYEEQFVTSYHERYSRINKLGAEVTIGINTLLHDILVLDFYAGLGIRYSFLNSNADNPKTFNDFYYDYGYTGNLIVLGVRIGIVR